MWVNTLAYDADAICADLASRKIEAVIPGRSNRRVKIEHDRYFTVQAEMIATGTMADPALASVQVNMGGPLVGRFVNFCAVSLLLSTAAHAAPYRA